MIPILSALCFRLGGCGKDDRLFPFMNPPTPYANKWWRWIGIGIVCGLLYWKGLIPLCLTLGSYFLVTNACPYGESSWLRKLLGRDGCWLAYGFLFGIASFALLGWVSLLQALIGSGAFYGLMKLSNDGLVLDVDGVNGIEKRWYLDQCWVEAGIGLAGTICYLIPK